jgi:ribosome recycling factor
MTEDVDMVISMADDSMSAAIAHLEKELGHLRAGKASPRMLDSVMVDYYGTMTPLSQTASITTPDAKTIVIQPWEKQMISPIEKAIINSNLGFNPDNNGDVIRVFIPPLTEERRKSLVKDVNKEGENARISIRNARKDAKDELHKLQKEGLSEDFEKQGVDQVQKLTDEYNKKIDVIIDNKNKEILTV